MSADPNRDVFEEQFQPPVNPVTQKKYKQQAWWQVTFPVVLVTILLVAAVVVLIILGGSQAVSIVADYSLVLLCLLAALPVLLVVALFGGLVYLMAKALGKTPPLTYKVQMFIEKVYHWVDEATDRVAGVVINASSKMAGVEAAMHEAGINLDMDPADTPPGQPGEQTNTRS